MDGLDDTRVVRLRVAPLDQEGRRWRFGSGYLAGPGRILTACHVLRPPDTEQLPTRGDSCDVSLWPCDSDEGWLPASVEWVDPDRDVAVVALSSDRDVPAVRFGRLAGAPVLPWRARGFPIAALGSEGRQPESAWGRLSPAGEGCLALTVESRRPGKSHDGESGWAGLSGAAVFCGAYLVGVVTTDPAQWVCSLEASIVAPITEDGEFREALGHHPMVELVRESSRAAGVTINVARATAALGARVALAPPKFGEWGLVGREEDLARLHDHLSAHGQAAVVPVAGLGGLGKTALALGYAARYGAGYDLVAWVDAERTELIPGQYRALVRNRTGQDLPETEAVAAAKALLANTESCLVVFDNASSPAELHPYLPAGEGRVLVTTRNETWSANAELTVSLDKLPRPVVARWLTRALPGSSTEAIERLAERLDGLPLAIVQAIAYITARPGESASSYLDRLATKSGQRDLLEAKTPPGYPRPVATTWDLAAETLAAEAPQALELLRHLAFVNPDRIPLAVIDGLVPGTDTPALLDALRNLGMISCSSTHVSLHRLVQDVTRWSLVEEEGTYVQRWARQLRGASSDPEDHAAFEWYADIAAHVLTLADHASLLHLNAPDLGVLITHTGVSLRLQAAYTLALTVLEQALGVNEAAYGPDHSQMAIILLNLGNAHHELGHYQKAIGLYDRALPIFEGAHGPDHPKVAITLSNLGLTHQRLGGYQEAIGLYDRALRILEGAYGPDHPEVARTLTNLGLTHHTLGRYETAIGLYDRALRIFEGASGPDHPHVASTLTNLGNAHRDLGRYQTAIELHDRALGILEGAYGPDHPDVASILTNLGLTHHTLGRYETAIGLYDRALRIFEGASGPDHPLVATTLTNLGNAHRELGRYQTAIEVHDRALRIFEGAYGPDHPHVASGLTNLGMAHRELGRCQEAIGLHDRALRIFEGAYGPGHPHVASTLTNLGMAHRELGHHQEAIELHRRALRIFEAAYGPDHPHSREARRLLEGGKLGTTDSGP